MSLDPQVVTKKKMDMEGPSPTSYIPCPPHLSGVHTHGPPEDAVRERENYCLHL